ncbi:hypothetical protein [uncultured Tateyamaria sp.]|uniref:hypothetical protein n=1 Tax=uncultured Tateyamaria sp. TaxID=455651 RepID=UPI00263199C2|nr:hypothetical protein [uncultured Tateyamaria sp.]
MRRLFESVVEKCVGFGFVDETDAAFDGSTIEADSNKERKGAPQEIEKLWSNKEQV